MSDVIDDAGTDAGPLNELVVNQFKIVEVDGHAVGVLRGPDDTIFACLNRCPHKNAEICKGMVGGTLLPSTPEELEYGLEDELIRCPWHGMEFSLRTGQCVFTDESLRLRLYETEVRDGRVYVLGPKRRN